MRNLRVAPMLIAVIALGIASRASAQQPGPAVTLTAQVIDLSCKFVQDASGPEHRMCAEVCADQGQPLGLLTADGQFYLPVNAGMGAAGENERLKPFAEQQVRVTGRVIDRGGVKAILIESVARG
jgi:hypothetical protein